MNFWKHIFVILTINKHSLGSCEVPHKMWARSARPFRRLIDTNGRFYISFFLNWPIEHEIQQLIVQLKLYTKPFPE